MNFNSDRKALIRLAHSLPKGSEERRSILTGLASESHNLAKEAARSFDPDELGMLSAMGKNQIERYLGKRGALMEDSKDPGFIASIKDGPNTIVFGETKNGKKAVKVIQGGGYGEFYLIAI